MIKVSVANKPESKSRHNKLVFLDEISANKKDMLNSVGRFNELDESVYFIDTPEANKFRVLSENGFQLHISRASGDNYYISTIQNVIEQSSQVNESIEDEIHNSNALYLSATKIGTFDGDEYQLYADVDEYLEAHAPDFALSYNENGQVDVSQMTYGEQVLLQKAIHFSGNSVGLTEAVNAVDFPSLASVKNKLSTITVELKNGNVADAKKVITKLRNEIEEYNNAVPPVKNVEMVVVQLDAFEKEIEKNTTEKKNDVSLEEAANNIMEMKKPLPKSNDLLEEALKLI